MVRVAGAARPDRVGTRPFASPRRPHAAADAARRSASERSSSPPSSRASGGGALPRAGSRGDRRSAPSRTATEAELRRARNAVCPADLPGADAARGRPGPAVPLHLGPVAEPRRRRARSRVERGALRTREGARGPAPLRRDRRRGACTSRSRSVIEHFLPTGSSRRWRSSSASTFRLTRDGDTEISDDADDLLEAVESELQKRRFGAVVRLEVERTRSRARCSPGSRSDCT